MSLQTKATLMSWLMFLHLLLYVLFVDNITILINAILLAIFATSYSIRDEIRREGFRKFSKIFTAVEEDKNEGS